MLESNTEDPYRRGKSACFASEGKLLVNKETKTYTITLDDSEPCIKLSFDIDIFHAFGDLDPFGCDRRKTNDNLCAPNTNLCKT